MIPASSARARVPSSGWAVIRTVGIGLPDRTRRRWSSSPLIPGILMSAIKHEVRWRRPDVRKSWAHGYASVAKPTALIRLTIASRTDSSSSTTTIAITGFFLGIPAFDLLCVARLTRPAQRLDLLHVGTARLYVGNDG